MKQLCAIVLWLMACATPVYAQQVVSNPVGFAWDANAPDENVTGYRLLVDQTLFDVGDVLTFTSTFPAGTHVAALFAYSGALVSGPSAELKFLIPGQAPDPCTPPLGSHAPGVFPTSPTFTTGKPGSVAFLNYLMGGPDPIVEVAIQIDGVDQLPIGKGTDLGEFSGRRFLLPAVGTHTLGIRVVSSFGCTLIRNTATPLVVKP